MDATLEPKTRRRSTHRPSEDDFVGSSPVERRPRPRSRQTAPARRGSYDITFDDENIALGMMDSSIWHDAPLFVAILPCLAAFVFGTEYVQDIILFLCICWYLHTAISLPWSLYEASRPRPMTRQARQNMTPQQITAHESLQWRSLWLLAFAFVAPFAGLVLIQQILKSVGANDGGPYVTYFHGVLFVLFGGVRPINHIAALIAGSTRELQGRVHHPPKDPQEEELEMKVERLEMMVSTLTERFRENEENKLEDTKKQQGMLEVQDTFEKTAARLETGARRRERKMEMAVELVERRLEGLEKQYDSVLSLAKERNPVNGNSKYTGEPTLRSLLLKWMDWAEEFWLSWRPRRASSSSNTYTTGGLLRRSSIPASNGAWSGRGSTSSNAAALQRRRSYDAPAPNLDTVVEEGPETDVDVTSDRDILMMDLPGDNTPGHTISANGLRRRSQGVDGLENTTSTSVNQTKAAGSASPFVRVYVEESRKTKGKHHFKTDGDSGVIEG
ncbi:hypothetical protein FRC20_005816 [Serendipita sp. 405]|nr:hypothetical protein FRC20_005816 [Serendipita sp. 405]